MKFFYDVLSIFKIGIIIGGPNSLQKNNKITPEFFRCLLAQFDR